MDDCLRRALLSLHSALIDFERRSYEKAHGRTAGGEFLQALLHEPRFDWLAPLTSLIASLDELDEDARPGKRRPTWRVRALLASDGDFAAQCAERVQLSPEVAFAHAAAVHAARAGA